MKGHALYVWYQDNPTIPDITTPAKRGKGQPDMPVYSISG